MEATEEQVPGFVSPDALRVTLRFPPPDVAIRANVRERWGRIAIRAETRALDARKRGHDTEADRAI
jgi:hypothetical protein